MELGYKRAREPSCKRAGEQHKGPKQEAAPTRVEKPLEKKVVEIPKPEPQIPEMKMVTSKGEEKKVQPIKELPAKIESKTNLNTYFAVRFLDTVLEHQIFSRFMI